MAPSGLSSRSASASYTRTAVVLHWLLAVALLGQFVLGWWMLDIPKSPPGLRAGWFNLHKSIGLTIAVLVVVRLAWRTAHRVTIDEALPAWQRSTARVAHGLLYLCMLVMPLSGYLGSAFTRYPVRYFGMRLPSWNVEWPAAKELMSSIHYATAWLFIALVALHVGAALWHWWRGDPVAARMGFSALPKA